MDFKIRALEIHDSSQIWNMQRLNRILQFMVKNTMNTLILHQVDIIDEVLYLGEIFNSKKNFTTIQELYQEIFRTLYQYAPRRRSAPNNKLEFLKLLLGEASQAGIDVYLENKELWFPDILLEFKPSLLKNGKVCPSQPFWWEEFLPAKYKELFTLLPGLSGMITSTATGESKVSITRSRCRCQECQELPHENWHKNIIMGIYNPIKAAGKKLVIRDFVFDRSSQRGFAEAAQDMPSDIIISIKNTPHDYYPSFPDNPLIGRVGQHEQWIEFDAMAQYFGWGIAPSIMIDDMRTRMKYALEKQAGGVVIRTDWESLKDHSCFDTPNVLNLYGAAWLSKNINAETKDIYYKWLLEENMLKQSLSSGELNACLEELIGIFERTWPIVKQTLYMNDCVFNDCSTMPVSIEHASWLAEEKNSLKDWDPSKEDALVMTRENVLSIFQEKQEALKEYHDIFKKLTKKNPGLQAEIYEDFIARFHTFGIYIKGFTLIGKAFALTNFLEREGQDALLSNGDPASEKISEILKDLSEYEKSLREGDACLEDYPKKLLLNPDRVACFRKSVAAIIDQMEGN